MVKEVGELSFEEDERQFKEEERVFAIVTVIAFVGIIGALAWRLIEWIY